MAKRPITTADLASHLDEQIGFLERSAASFDEGYEDEAKRLAVTLRVLLHETSQSHSLLGQLGSRDRLFTDTAMDFDPANKLSHGGLVYVAVGAPRTRYVSQLDDVPISKQISFDQWWSGPVFVDAKRNILTRKDLVLIAANQDGGAHVDPALDETYLNLSRENSMRAFAVENGEQRPMEGPERAAIRQIAHEVLKTLKPGYQKMPSHKADFFAGGMTLVEGDPSAVQLAMAKAGREMAAKRAPRKTVGRNQPCPCGSGMKFKRCHGRVA